MKVVAAIDSFKGSMTSIEAGMSAKEGVLRVFPDADVVARPLADGGEGTVDTLVSGMHGKKEKIQVCGPAGRKVDAEYGIIEELDCAIIEMASAAGITLVKEEERNPLYTTTYGVGEMIRDAIKKGCRHFIVGIGGSATNDGGTGMLQALGYDFLDVNGEQIPSGAAGLEKLVSISDTNVIRELKSCTFRIACDVNNPLCGKLGCSAIYGPQKGATPSMIREMDEWLKRYAKIAKEKYPDADPAFPGAGAAGGLGFAFLTFTNARLESGTKIILEETKLEDYIREADIVLTGEGRIDAQTAMGKCPIGVARLAKKYDKPLIAFAGSVSRDASVCNREGIDAIFPIVREVCTLEEAMKKENAMSNMKDTVTV